MPIHLKILAASLCAMAVTIAIGLFSLSVERRLGELAIRVYDEALMSVAHLRAAGRGGGRKEEQQRGGGSER